MSASAAGEPRLREPDPATIQGLQAALDRAGYTSARIERALGPRPPLELARREVYVRRLEDAGDLGVLVRLFRLRDPVTEDAAAGALAPAELAALAEAGIVEARDGRIAAKVDISEYQGLRLLHDSADPSAPVRGWEVLYGAASRTLGALTIRRPVRLALDLGTGCGVQALLAARHAERVIATDLGDRPLTFTRINATLNGAANIETRQGNLFEPVAGERFGLIVSNPPFVISPETGVMFRDSSLPGDEISRRVVADAQEHLEEGGHGTVLCSWIAPSEGHWSGPLRAWAAPGCDAMFLQFTSVRPLQYAAMWTDDLDAWLDYYRSEGIAWISTGAAIVRREAPGGRVTTFQANGAPTADATGQLLRIFEALAERSDDDGWYLGARFGLVEHRLDQVVRWRDGAYAVDLTGVAIPGTPLNARVDKDAIHVLGRLDGATELSRVIDRAAAETGLDRAGIEAAALATVRRLYERGFLVRSS